MSTPGINLDALTNPTVKAAIEALQQGNIEAWKSLFTDDADLYDDGKPRDLEKFSATAIGSERFTSIDKVDNEGRDVYGNFHSDQWGDFKTYFKFQLTDDHKVKRLDIGQS